MTFNEEYFKALVDMINTAHPEDLLWRGYGSGLSGIKLELYNEIHRIKDSIAPYTGKEYAPKD
jgi:hypothetical protein